MKREEVHELHYITPMDNVTSILCLGILSHARVAKLKHESVAMAEIQEIRANRQIPGARSLHEHVNLYFDAHNPMLSKVRGQNGTICVLRVNTKVLDLPGVIVADRNASSAYVTFRSVAEGIQSLDKDRLFARYWTHPNDPLEEMRHKSEKCAEVLVPDNVSPELIVGAYVANQVALGRWQGLGVGLAAVVKYGLFF